MKIYTKTGDDGTTALFDGTRVKKHQARVAVYGEVDELNSSIGMALSFVKDKNFHSQLLTIQKNLFALGAKLANPKEKKQREKADFGEEKITELENEIDEMEKSLTKMTVFILPGGCHTSAFLHHARTICRRVERKLVELAETEAIDAVYIKFINRLSDHLFVCARYANFLEKIEDIKWE